MAHRSPDVGDGLRYFYFPRTIVKINDFCQDQPDNDGHPERARAGMKKARGIYILAVSHGLACSHVYEWGGPN
jgi:hypothetical protein